MYCFRLTVFHRTDTPWLGICTFPFTQGGNAKRRIESMSEFQEPINQSTTGTPRWVGLAVAVLGVASLAGIGIGYSAVNHANKIEETTQASGKQANDTLGQRLAKAEDQNQQLQSDLKVVTDKLNVTQSDLIEARKQTKKATVAYEKKLSGLQSSVLSELAAKASADDVNK